MATTAKKPAKGGFRQRRSQSPPPPPDTEVVDEASDQEEDVVEARPAAPTKAPAKKPTVEKSAPANETLPPAGDAAGVGEGSADLNLGDPRTLGAPEEDTVILGVSMTVDLWKSYKKLQNHTAIEGRTIRIAEITRAVIARELPSSYTDEGLVRARKYAEDWTRKRDASSSPRTNRQLHLPSSAVKDLKRLSMVLEDRGYPASTSAIVSGILDEHLPALASVKKLVEN